MKNEFLINSIGGCGSKYLINQITMQSENENSINCHAHVASPLLIGSEKNKVVFVFGDLYLSLQSFFNRRNHITKLHGFTKNRVNSSGNKEWAKAHCKNIGGDCAPFDAGWELIDYLRNGHDLYRANRFYNSWLSPDKLKETHYDVLYIKYEGLGANFNNVANFLELEVNKPIEPFVERGSQKELFSLEEVSILEEIYGETQKKLESLPDTFTKTDILS